MRDSDLNPINNIMEIGKSICKIITSKSLGTGFLIKLNKKNKQFYCLMTNEHVIKQNMISNKETIKVFYDNQRKNFELELNKNERFIQDFLYLGLDVTLIEILPKDNISDDYFLLPNLEYINGYKQFENKKIYIFQFPEGGNLSYSVGIIQMYSLHGYRST